MRSLLKCLCGSTWPAENSKDSGAVEREDGTAHVPGDVRVLADQQLQEPPPQTREAREEHDGFHGLASSPGRGDGAAGRSEVSLHAMGLEGLRPVAEDEAVAVCEEGAFVCKRRDMGCPCAMPCPVASPACRITFPRKGPCAARHDPVLCATSLHTMTLGLKTKCRDVSAHVYQYASQAGVCAPCSPATLACSTTTRRPAR